MCDLSCGAGSDASVEEIAGPGGGGSTSGTQTCCPDVVEFKKRTNRKDYFGFDDKTNLVASGNDPYWVPPTTTKSAPSLSDAQAGTLRDGSVWLSVEKSKTTTVTIDFTNNLTCISNATYEVTGGHVTVLTSNITADRARFDIRGTSAGDSMIKVMCDGKILGWAFVACHERKTYSVAICEVNQQIPLPPGAAGPQQLRLPRHTKSVSEFQTFFDDAWRDAAVKVDLDGLPMQYVTSSTADLSPGGDIFDANGNSEYNHIIANFATMMAATNSIHAKVSAAHPGYDKYLYLIVAPGPMNVDIVSGFAESLPGTYGVFFNQGNDSMSTACHEFGHLVSLRHMNDDQGRSQYPTHLQLPKTDGSNINALDNDNLMGYGYPRTSRKRLRYMQWKSVQGR